MLEINKMLLFVAFCYFLYFVVNLQESGKSRRNSQPVTLAIISLYQIDVNQNKVKKFFCAYCTNAYKNTPKTPVCVCSR